MKALPTPPAPDGESVYRPNIEGFKFNGLHTDDCDVDVGHGGQFVFNYSLWWGNCGEDWF